MHCDLICSIETNIKYHLSISCNTFVIVMIYKTANNLVNNSGIITDYQISSDSSNSQLQKEANRYQTQIRKQE